MKYPGFSYQFISNCQRPRVCLSMAFFPGNKNALKLDSRNRCTILWLYFEGECLKGWEAEGDRVCSHLLFKPWEPTAGDAQSKEATPVHPHGEAVCVCMCGNSIAWASTAVVQVWISRKLESKNWVQVLLQRGVIRYMNCISIKLLI